jgi:predicted DNA-binding transcriptional regulator AlpA
MMLSSQKILSLRNTASRLGIHLRSLQRMLANGTGPATVRLTDRRVGILETDLDAWITSRRRGTGSVRTPKDAEAA